MMIFYSYVSLPEGSFHGENGDFPKETCPIAPSNPATHRLTNDKLSSRGAMTSESTAPLRIMENHIHPKTSGEKHGKTPSDWTWG